MTNDVGFFIPHISNDDLATDRLLQIKKLIDNNPFKQITIFNGTTERFDHMNIPILPISHARYFIGDLFLFDVMSLLITNSFPNVKNKYFYTNEVPWINGYGSYQVWNQLLSQANLQILTVDEQLQDIYKICWDSSGAVIKIFSYEELANVLR